MDQWAASDFSYRKSGCQYQRITDLWRTRNGPAFTMLALQLCDNNISGFLKVKTIQSKWLSELKSYHDDCEGIVHAQFVFMLASARFSITFSLEFLSTNPSFYQQTSRRCVDQTKLLGSRRPVSPIHDCSANHNRRQVAWSLALCWARKTGCRRGVLLLSIRCIYFCPPKYVSKSCWGINCWVSSLHRVVKWLIWI